MKTPSVSQALNRDFHRFQTQIIGSRKQNLPFFISELKRHEKKYTKAGLSNIFMQKLFEFAQNMQNSGIKDLPGIIFSHLVKQTQTIDSKSRENYVLKALAYAQEQEDLIRTLAHLVDLEKIYKQSGESHKYTEILFKKEKVLKSICSDYEKAKNNYKTNSKKCSPLATYEIELATTRVDIAKKIFRKKPNLASSRLKKARETFEKYDKQKGVDFVNLILSQISR